MENTDESKEKTNPIAELYPDLSPSEREEAAYYLNRYLDLIERIYERLND